MKQDFTKEKLFFNFTDFKTTNYLYQFEIKRFTSHFSHVKVHDQEKYFFKKSSVRTFKNFSNLKSIQNTQRV